MVVISCFLILTIAASIFVNMELTKQAEADVVAIRGPDFSKSVKTQIKVEARDAEGNLKQTVIKDNDLILENFAKIAAGWFTNPIGTGSSVTVYGSSLKDTAGASQTTYVKTPSMNVATLNWVDTGYARYVRIQVGTTGGSPSVTDFALGVPVENMAAVSTPTVTGGNLTFYAACSMTASRTIQEAGVFLTEGKSSAKTFLLLHDTFSGISVVATDTVTVTYTLMCGTGFTTNWLNLLAAFFTPRASADGTLTCTMTDDGGSARTFNVLGGALTIWIMDTDAYPNNACVKIGTGTNAPALADYDLQTPVESYVQNQAPIMLSNINITIASTFQVTADRTITEAGFYIRGKDTGGLDRYGLLWRDTFTGAAVSSGRQITINMIVYFNV